MINILKQRPSRPTAGQRLTAERLLQSLGQGSSCLLRSTGEARHSLQELIQPLLLSSGLQTQTWSLTGVTPAELPGLVSLRLGLGHRLGESTLSQWLLLEEYFSAARDCELQWICWWDLALVGPELVPGLVRLEGLMGSAARHVFLAEPHGSIAEQLLETTLHLTVLTLESRDTEMPPREAVLSAS